MRPFRRTALILAGLVITLGAAAASLAGPAAADTQVPAGALAADATWTASGSPYVLAGNLTVPAGVTLTLDAGTQVKFPSGGHFVVEGDLHAWGTAASGVLFGPDLSDWAGMIVRQDGNATVLNATFLAPDRGLTVQTTGTVFLADTSFRTVLGDAVAVTGGAASVTLQNVNVLGATRALVAGNGAVNIAASRFTVSASVFCVEVSSASFLSLRNFSLAGCGSAAVNISLSSDILLEGGNISEWTGYAVAAVSAARVNISGNSFYTSIPSVCLNLVGLSDSVVANNDLAMIALPGGAVLPVPPVAIDLAVPLGANRIESNSIRTFNLGIRVSNAIFPQRIAMNRIAAGGDTGIEIVDSPNQTIEGNTITGRNYSFAVNVTSAATPWYFRQYLDLNNTADGRPILYLLDVSGGTLDLTSGPAVVALVDSANVTVVGANLTKGMPSLLVANSRDIVVRDSTIQSNVTGVDVFRSVRVLLDNLTVNGGLNCVRFWAGADNRASRLNTSICLQAVLTQGAETRLIVENISINGSSRISFFEGSGLTLRDARVTSAEDIAFSNGATWIGRGGQSVVQWGRPDGFLVHNVTIEGARDAIVLYGLSNATFREVHVAQSVRALSVRSVSQLLVESSDLTGSLYGVEANNLTDSAFRGTTVAGAALRGISCHDCVNVSFLGNTFAANSVALGFLRGSGCLVTQNFFFFNTLHATADSSVHDFDNGSVGNLWDDYTGIDADGNGIGDTPYLIATGVDQDRYPIARFPDDIGPVANAGPDIVAFEDAPVLLNGYLSTDDVGVRVHLWSFVDGGANITVSGISTRYIFRTPGVYAVTLTVIDWGANRATDTVKVTILDRTRPHADAGGDRTVDEDAPAPLDATPTTDNDPRFPEGAAFTWWVEDTNGTFVLVGQVTSWTFGTPGNFTVRLTVDDAAGFSDSTTFSVTVRDRTPPVVPPLEEPPAVEDFPFRVYGSSPTDNDPLWPKGMTEWFELWRAGTLVGAANSSPAVFNVSEPGPYTVTYFVRDAAGNVGASSLTFLVGDRTPPDVSLYADRSAEAGVPVSFDLTFASDNSPLFPAGAEATWTFQLPGELVTLVGPAVEYAFPMIGDFTGALHLRDAGGNLAEVSFVVRVRDTTPPTITVSGPTSIEAGDEALFVSTVGDFSGTAEVTWHVSGLATPRHGAVLTYRFFTPGSYEVMAVVEDMLGHRASASISLFVVDTSPPTMVIESVPLIRGGSVNISAGASFQATFLGSDTSGLAGVEWGWGDGNVSTGTTASHAFVEPGNYTVLVRASDAFGNSNSTTFVVQVTASPAGPPPSGGNESDQVPTPAQFPAFGLVAFVAAAAAGGSLLGFRLGRGRKRGQDKPP